MTTLVQDPGHAKRSASSAYRWMACTGSPELIAQAAPERTSSIYAAEGTVAHQVAAECLSGGGPDPAKKIGQKYSADGFEFTVDQEMADAVWTHVEFCIWLMQARNAWWKIEADLTPALREVHPDFGGHADFVCYHPKTKTLWVVDYKHGSGVLVDVEDNLQLRYYALGALLGADVPVEKVVSVVVQPRCQSGTVDPVREQAFSPIDLFDLQADLLEAARKGHEEPELVAGDHCRFCPVAACCPKLKEHTDLIMTDQFDLVEESVELTPEQLAEALRIAPAVEARISALRQLGYDLAMQGLPPPGFKLVAKRATSKWSSDEEASEALDIVLGDQRWAERKLITPAQALKLGGKDSKKLIESLITKTSSGYNLVPEEDRRPAAALGVMDDFDNVND